MEYTFYKLIHILGVILFLGNIIVGLFWMHIAVKANDAKILAHTLEDHCGYVLHGTRSDYCRRDRDS